MQIYQVLKQEHDKVKALFEELEETTERALKTRTQTLQKLQQELSVHMEFEEEHLYPRLEEPEETHELALEAVEEHNAARTLLAELSEPTTTSSWTRPSRVWCSTRSTRVRCAPHPRGP
jgi:iron-sulfur cluster repair protein YtfE (RIC family)